MSSCKMCDCVVQPLLTDFYQVTMAYAYWKGKKHEENAVFDLFFRKNPFYGEFTIFAGLDEVLKFLQKFSFSKEDIDYIRDLMPVDVEEEFLTYLKDLNTNQVSLLAIEEGNIAFPKVPLIRVEGPLGIVQLFETTLLNLVNYASLVTTNAARYRIASGNRALLEFGLRRAQGPNGGLSASKYCFMGGFDATSNLLAGKLYGIPVKGTHAHSFICSFDSLKDIRNQILKKADKSGDVDIVQRSLYWREQLEGCYEFPCMETNESELAAFISYAFAFPSAFLCLIDTYDVIKSGVRNFCAVAMALSEAGYSAVGVRLDSGDLAYLSTIVRKSFENISEKYKNKVFSQMIIVASNDINEDTIISLNQQEHSIDSFGIGTHIVTCQKQPALGCVYKLAEVNKKPCIKLSEDPNKISMPGGKLAYRLYGVNGFALVDLLTLPTEPAPLPGQKILCRHPFQETKRAYVIPSRVETLYKCYFKNGKVQQLLPSLKECRSKVMESLSNLRMDHKRSLNATPYKVSVTDGLYHFIHELWLSNAPIGKLL